MRQLLDSAVPMFIVWGSDETFLYNDAYVPILGRRHPEALGRPFAQVWPEAYAAVAPAVAQVMTGRPASFEHAPFSVTRNGIEEQAWFSFTYSPLRRLDGAVRGFACVVAETTDIDAALACLDLFRADGLEPFPPTLQSIESSFASIGRQTRRRKSPEVRFNGRNMLDTFATRIANIGTRPLPAPFF